MESRLKPLVFKACLAAAWSDRAMTPLEREHLAGLIESLSETDEERQEFRKLALEDVHPEILLAEVEDLGKTGKRVLFEECLSLLKEDGKLQIADLRFLGRLRTACGIGFWAYQRRLWSLGWTEKVRMTRWRYVLLLLSLAAGLLIWKGHEDAEYPPEESSKVPVYFDMVSFRGTQRPRARSSSEVYKEVKDSVVHVGLRLGEKHYINGSGFVVGFDKDGAVYFVTNKHVIRNKVSRKTAPRIRVRYLSGAYFDAKLDFYSRKKDLALLRVDKKSPHPRPLPLAPAADLEVGDHVYAMGNPIGFNYSFTAGIISAIRDDFIQTDATATHGSSGGPLIDGYGRLCGVVTKSHDAKDYSFALSGDDVLNMLRERRDFLGYAGRGN